MDLKESIPTFIRLHRPLIHDSKIMDDIYAMENAYYLMDKGYVKFDLLYKHFHQNHTWFVTIAKNNMSYIVILIFGLDSSPMIRLTGFYTSKKYPDNLRLVAYEDFRDGAVYSFLINISQLTQSLLLSFIVRLRSSSSGSSAFAYQDL